MSFQLRIAFAAAFVVFLVLGYFVRDSVQVAANVDSIRDFIHSTGVWGPVIFVGLFLVRGPLLLPGVVLLTAGGVGFGFLGGMVLGTLGLMLSALLKYAAAVVAGREWLIAKLPERLRARLSTLNHRGSTGVLALATAYPIGPGELLQTAAILGGIRFAPLAAAVSAGSVVRAGSLSYFGDTIVDGSGLLLASAILVTLAALPLAFPRVRRVLRLRG